MADGLAGKGLRQPPANIAAEQAVLGALLENNDARRRCGDLRAHHFSDQHFGKIFARLTELIDAGRAVSAVTLLSEFDSHTLADLTASTISTYFVDEYAQAIIETWMQRQAITTGEDLLAKAYGGEAGFRVGQLIAETSERLATISIANARRSRTAAEVVTEVMEQAQAVHKAEAGAGGLYTGVPSIDRLWGGLWPGRLYYLVAMSKTGKSAALLQFTRHMARTLLAEQQAGHAGGCVHLFCLDMSVRDFMTVNFAAESRWTGDQITAGDIGDAEAWMALSQIGSDLGKLPLVIEPPRIDLSEFRARVRAVKREHNTRVVGIDYLDRILRDKEHRRMDRAEWVPFLGDQLKELAEELDIAILALRQVNKPRDPQAPAKPTSDDMPFDRGAAADEIYVLYRRELDMGAEPPGLSFVKSAEDRAQKLWEWQEQRRAAANQAELICVKKRFGRLGYIPLTFDGPRMTLRDIDIGMTTEEQDMFARGEL